MPDVVRQAVNVSVPRNSEYFVCSVFPGSAVADAGEV